MHSGVIDKPMYELLLEADVVVADLSASNAIYELGVRHALRPRTTIVIAEKEFKFPFDVGHLLIRTYEHLGKDIEYDEAERLRKMLADAIRALVEKEDVDSPVFTFLPKLMPKGAAPPPVPEVPPAMNESVSEMLQLCKEARAQGNWTGSARILSRLHEKLPNDVYVTQQLALATYQIKQPDAEAAEAALLKAKENSSDAQPGAERRPGDARTLGRGTQAHLGGEEGG